MITTKMTLDVLKAGIQGSITLVQGEEAGRLIVFSLRVGSSPLGIEAGVYASLHGEKPDGTILYEPCVCYTKSGEWPDAVVYEVTEQMTAVAGCYELRLMLVDEEGAVLYSPRFTVMVDNNGLIASPVTSLDSYRALVTDAARAMAAAGRAEAVLEGAVKKSTRINGYTLDEDIELGADDVDAYSKEESDYALSRKVDKPTDGVLYSRVFTVPVGEAEPVLTEGSHKATGGTVAIRDPMGRLEVGDAGNDGDAVNKRMLDRHIADQERKNAGFVATLAGAKLELSIDNDTYVMTARLKNAEGNVLSESAIDLPLESMMLGGHLEGGFICLTLKPDADNEPTVLRIPYADIIKGLVSEDALANALRGYVARPEAAVVGNRIFAVPGGGTEAVLLTSGQALGNSLPERGEDGLFEIGELPTSPRHPVSLSYMKERGHLWTVVQPVSHTDSEGYTVYTVTSGAMSDIPALTGKTRIVLSEALEGYDTEWNFCIVQGEEAQTLVLPTVSWGFGFAPVFGANSQTVCRLYMIGGTLCGEWAAI